MTFEVDLNQMLSGTHVQALKGAIERVDGPDVITVDVDLRLLRSDLDPQGRFIVGVAVPRILAVPDRGVKAIRPPRRAPEKRL